jgi:hypothetical protein
MEKSTNDDSLVSPVLDGDLTPTQDNVWSLGSATKLLRSQTVTYYLQSKGKANTLNGDGTLTVSPSSFRNGSYIRCWL